MKKWMILTLSLLLALSLTACGRAERTEGGQSGAQTAAPAPPMTERAKAELEAQGFEVVSGEPAALESVEELFAACRDVEKYGGMAISEEWAATGVPTLGDLAALEDAGETVPFSDDPWEEKTVEETDITANMTPEEKAEWEEFQNTDWEAMAAETEELVAGFQSMGGEDLENAGGGSGTEDIDMDDLQRQLDEAERQAKEELENLPPEYHQYLPEGFDINDPLGGMDLDGLTE